MKKIIHKNFEEYKVKADKAFETCLKKKKLAEFLKSEFSKDLKYSGKRKAFFINEQWVSRSQVLDYILEKQ